MKNLYQNELHINYRKISVKNLDEKKINLDQFFFCIYLVLILI